MKNQILELLKMDGVVEMETEHSCLTIYFRDFFSGEKEFLFILNSKAVDSCKTEKTALKKIQKFIDRGFYIVVK